MVTISCNYLNDIKNKSKKNSYKTSAGGTPSPHLQTSQVETGTTLLEESDLHFKKEKAHGASIQEF